jgi:hypothetical protein
MRILNLNSHNYRNQYNKNVLKYCDTNLATFVNLFQMCNIYCNTQTHYCLYSGFKISFFQKRRSRWNKDIDLNQLIDKMLVRDVTLLVTKIILLYLI